MRLYCPEEGGHEVKVRFQPSQGERFCPDHRCLLLPLSVAKRSKAMGRVGRRESSTEERARKHFNAVVTARRCYFSDTTFAGEPRRPGHKCRYPLDSHHLIPKEWMRRELDLPEDELIAVMFNPLVGAPLCRAAHDAVECRTDFIYLEEIDDDLIDLCERFDRQHPGCRSLLARLEIESPKQEEQALHTAAPGRSTA